MQYRAIGLVRGTYVPGDPNFFTKGKLVDEDGVKVEAVVLGRVMNLMQRHLEIAKPHLWVVYPRCRKDDFLHLQIVGVWEPSTLELDKKSEVSKREGDLSILPKDELPEGDDYFSIRGELIFTKPERGELVVKVRQQARTDKSKANPFKLKLKGKISIDCLGHFISLDARRYKQNLHLENYETIAPIPNKDIKKKQRNHDHSRKEVKKEGRGK